MSSSPSVDSGPSPAEPGPGRDDDCADLGLISPQAIRLHAFGLIAAIRADSGGLIGRTEAERLADRAGALVDELTEFGLWLEADVSYVVRAGALTAAARASSQPGSDDGAGAVSSRG